LEKNTVRIYLVEGYATGYTLYRVTGGVVFVCFDVNNIGVLAKQLSERFPFIEFIVTNNDRKKTTKVGLFWVLEYSYDIINIYFP
jgi:putative DNA primase/helicase